MPTDPYTGLDYLTETQPGKVALINAWLTVLAVGNYNRPAARAYHNADQSLTTATLTALALNNERFDNAGIHDVSTNNSRLTCITAGKYLIWGSAAYASNAVGHRQLLIRLNGTTHICAQVLPPATGIVTVLSVATVYSLAVTNYLELMGYQDSGGGLNVVSTGNYSPEMGMIWLSS